MYFVFFSPRLTKRKWLLWKMGDNNQHLSPVWRASNNLWHVFKLTSTMWTESIMCYFFRKFVFKRLTVMEIGSLMRIQVTSCLETNEMLVNWKKNRMFSLNNHKRKWKENVFFRINEKIASVTYRRHSSAAFSHECLMPKYL